MMRFYYQLLIIACVSRVHQHYGIDAATGPSFPLFDDKDEYINEAQDALLSLQNEQELLPQQSSFEEEPWQEDDHMQDDDKDENDDDEPLFMKPWQEQQDERQRRELQSCGSKQRSFYYRTNIDMQVPGGNPYCSSSELRDISNVLSHEYSRIVRIDPRLKVVYQINSQVCGLQGQGRRLQEEEEVGEEPEDDWTGGEYEEGNDADGRRLESFTWYAVHNYDGGRMYHFDWSGIGDCKWCPHNFGTRDSGRHLRGGQTSTYPNGAPPDGDEGLTDNVVSSSINATVDHEEQEGQEGHQVEGYFYPDYFVGSEEEEAMLNLVTEPEDCYNYHEEEMNANISSTTTDAVMHRELQSEEVARFAIVNTRTQRRVRTLNNFAICDLRSLGRDWTIKAETRGNIKSLSFDFDQFTNIRKEHHAPYFIGGDTLNQAGGRVSEFGLIRRVGTHTVKARPYSQSNKLGKSLTVAFLVIDSSRSDQEPDNDNELINLLEDDISFHLSYAVNRRFYNRRNHCLERHLVYVRVDMKDVRRSGKYQC